MRQKVIKLGQGRFRVLWEKLPEQAITLDFNPIIKRFNLNQYKDYVLLHWQARPHGLRRWGLYSGRADQYYGADWDKATFDQCNIQLLQIDELGLLEPPSAVVFIPDHCVHYSGEIIKCNEVGNGLVKDFGSSGIDNDSPSDLVDAKTV